MIRAAVTTVVFLTAAPLLASCGGSDDPGPTADATASEPALAGAPPSGAPGGGFMTPAQLTKIRTCLKAAGLEDELPDLPTGGPPSGQPTDRPTGRPSGEPPGGEPSGMPSGGPGGLFSEEVRQALTACGIELPTGGPSGQSSAG